MNALITGASRGLGLGLVARFAARPGSHVFAVARDPAASDELAKAVRESDGRISVIVADGAASNAGEKIAAAIGSTQLDLLVNNAGAMSETDFGDLSQHDLIEIFKVNTFAPLLVTQALRKNLSPGAKVVNVTSVLGSIARAGEGYLAYGMSKSALNMLTKKLATELEGVAVLSLHPGWVQTRMGGAGASITVDVSVDGMVRVIDTLDQKRTGAYLAYDGSNIPW
jgi:NAD(P)-dependent dehydrogenase (short-subunit alcohol dehydrogenase family)